MYTLSMVIPDADSVTTVEPTSCTFTSSEPGRRAAPTANPTPHPAHCDVTVDIRDSSPLTNHENGSASDPFDTLDNSGRSTRLRASLTAWSFTGRTDLASTVSVAPHALALAAAYAQERGPVAVRVVHKRPREERELADMLEQRVRSRRGGLVGRLLVWWVP
jgi:hypothetical protein